MTAQDVKRMLGMEPHPREGGWFAETYRSAAMLPASVFVNSAEPVRYDGPRRIFTAIYYLLEPGTFSEIHRLKSDEVFHHYAGAPVEMLQLGPGDRMERLVIGKDLAAGERPQVLVPRGVWQGSRLLPSMERANSPLMPAQSGEDAWALLGCTVSPGFAYEDYETGTRAELVERFPVATELIRALTRDVAY